MTIWEVLAAVVIGCAVGIPIGYVQFRIKQWRDARHD